MDLNRIASWGSSRYSQNRPSYEDHETYGDASKLTLAILVIIGLVIPASIVSVLVLNLQLTPPSSNAQTTTAATELSNSTYAEFASSVSVSINGSITLSATTSGSPTLVVGSSTSSTIASSSDTTTTPSNSSTSTSTNSSSSSSFTNSSAGTLDALPVLWRL